MVRSAPLLFRPPNVSSYSLLLSLESNQASFCDSCFEEACSRCSTTAEEVSKREGVRIDGLPVCTKPPLGSTASSSGTTVANITLEKGYFRTSNESHVILQCYRESACQGGKDADKYCAPGYTGPCEKTVCMLFNRNYHLLGWASRNDESSWSLYY